MSLTSLFSFLDCFVTASLLVASILFQYLAMSSGTSRTYEFPCLKGASRPPVEIGALPSSLILIEAIRRGSRSGSIKELLGWSGCYCPGRDQGMINHAISA